MTAFIRGLFGSKAQSSEVEAKPAPKAVERPRKDSSAFYLDANEAQTFGNLEYMQTSKQVKRTFPKTFDSPEHKEFVQDVSATGRVVKGKSAPAPSTTPVTETAPTQSFATSNEAEQRRKTDTSMDMFRSMAKDLRK